MRSSTNTSRRSSVLRSRTVLVTAVALVLPSFGSIRAQAPTATVTHNVNLRADPSTSTPPIRLLTPAESPLTLIDPNMQTRISDLAVVPYSPKHAQCPDFAGSDVRNPATEGDTLWVKKKTRRCSSHSTAS